MKNADELIFKTRQDFRSWLEVNATSSDGVWLVFSKSKDFKTLTANDALEEALCYGWIDGVMKSIDDSRYIKYFAKRRPKSVWSNRNKTIIDSLLKQNLVTPLGLEAIQNAKLNGMWDASTAENATDDQIEILTLKLKAHPLAYENFMKMSFSVKRTYARRYFSFKTEASQLKDFDKIVDRLNKNLKPM